MRILLAFLVVFCCSIAFAPRALAGDEVEGDGWSLRLPDGFTEAMSVEGNGNFKVTSRFGKLPIDGMPEIKAYTAGGGVQPKGMLMVARVDLTRSIDTAEELGLDDIEQMRSQLPEGLTVTTTTVGKYKAIEMKMAQEGYDADMISRVLTIACGDYVVVVMLATDEAKFPNSAVTWQDLKSSIEIDPPMSKWLLFGLIGAGALGAMFVLGRIGTRPTREIQDFAGRFKRFQDDAASPAASTPMGNAYTPMQTGVRPKVLPSIRGGTERPDFRAPQPPPMPAPSRGAAPPPPRGAPAPGTAGGPLGKEMPAPRATSPAVTRPAPEAPSQRAGLRATRPASGRWGQ